MSVNEKMTAIANEVRSLAGVPDKLGLDEMAAHTKDANAEVDTQEDLIEQIQVALQGKATAKPVIEPLEITENGTHVAPNGVDGYTPVVVNVPIPEGYVKPSGTLEITQNGTHDAEAYKAVSVNVPVPDGYIQPSGTLEVTENGEHDVTEYAKVNVNVPTGGGAEIVDTLINRSITEVSSEVGIIGAYAFTNCQNLESVNFPNVTTVQGYAFQNCYALKRISLPKTSGINGYGFMNCTALAEVDVPNLAGLSNYAFRKCTALTKVDLPKARSIGTYVFYECSALEAIILRKTDTPCTLAAANSFQYTPIAGGTGYIYVPSALIEDYKVATNWSTYAAQFRAIEDYPEITGG